MKRKRILHRTLLFILVTACAFGCKESGNKHIKEPLKSVVDKEPQMNDSISGLNNTLYSIVTDYVKKNPVDDRYEKSGYSKESYYVGFLKHKNDTLLAIFKQPFLMDDIFPERAFRRLPDHSDFSKLKSKPKVLGVTAWKDDLIVILDGGNWGTKFYDEKKLAASIPDAIKYNTPVNDELWHPNLYPVWKYVVKGERLIKRTIDEGSIYTTDEE